MSRSSGWLLVGAIFIIMLSRNKGIQSRGLRNNNPLNIVENDRVDYDWLGESIIDNDESFEVFEKPEFGIRAAGRILDSYRRKGFLNLYQIINRWAPAHENDTASYVEHVKVKTGWLETYELERSDYPALLDVMIRHENGLNPFSLEFIKNAVELA